MSEHKLFQQHAAEKAGDLEHKRKILKAIHSYEDAVSSMKADQFTDWQQARTRAAEIKDKVLTQLPELLETFEKRAQACGTKVLWARDDKEALQHVLEIVKRHQAKTVVKSKSMTTEEIGLNQALEAEGVKVWESDLGELIVQLAGESPYHIVTPAMHKSKAEISALFTKTLGCPQTDDAAELTLAARAHLRKAFCLAEIGISGANYLIAEQGAVVLTENEGNARLSTSCPPVHIAIAGIEKVLPSLKYLQLFLPLLSTSGTGQQLTCYNSMIRGPRQSQEQDGPDEMYVILLDNGRSKVYANPETRQILRCIRCGACLNACPVFRRIGGHTYHTTYQGPLGSALTPNLREMKQWHHLSSASSLCGACTDVCPVCINLHGLLLDNRWRAWQRGYDSALWNIGLYVWAWIVQKRTRLSIIRPMARKAISIGRLILPKKLAKRIPPLPEKSFGTLWREHEQQRTDS